jgi:hypothetical protein
MEKYFFVNLEYFSKETRTLPPLNKKKIFFNLQLLCAADGQRIVEVQQLPVAELEKIQGVCACLVGA